MVITALEKRLMLDASLGAIVTSVVFGEDTVNAAPQVLDNDVTISGTTTDFNGESLTISTDGGAEDQLSIVNEGTAAGQIGFDGSNVTYGGTLIGTLTSNGVNGNDLTVDLNANATKASIERLIENLNYRNVSDTPTQDHTITIALGTYFSENLDVTIVAQNDDPVTATNSGITLLEGASATITTTELDVTDTDDADSDIIFTVGSAPTNGQLELTTNTGVAITSFTRNDIANNRVVYVHNDTETTSDSFDFTVTDGDTTLTSDTFNITVTAVNDPLSLDTNAGVTVFQNLSTTIGGEAVQFGNELIRNSGVGNYSSWNNTIDNKSIQFSVIFTTPAGAPNGVPGEVLFESGGTGVGVGLVLNSSFELEFYAGPSAPTPELTGDALLANTQYAAVIEIDQATDEIRMHFEQADNFSWYALGRAAREVLTGYTQTDHSGSGNAAVGQMNPEVGGYNGTRSGVTTFQGSIDSDVVVTEFPTASGTPNTMLVYNDFDTNSDQIVYTVTTDVTNGTLFLNGAALGINDTFTQADLDFGFLTYTNSGGVTDSFGFNVTDGDTTIAGQTFTITIDTSNVAPEILHTTTILDEDFEGGTSGWNNNTTTDLGNDLTEFWGEFSRNIDVSGNQELFQTFATSGTQDYIVVEFDFYRLDSWDNEFFYAFINDAQVFTNQQFNTGYSQESDGTSGNVSYTVQERTDVAGYISGTSGWTDQALHYTMVIDTSDPTFKLGFGSNLNSSNLTDETFGIDNLKITEISKGGLGNQEFFVTENADNGDFVGTLQAIDDNAGQPLTYSITGGTGNGLFSIDASTGEITVADNSTFDFETTTSYTLDLHVTDGALSDTQTVTIQMVDVIENTAPAVTASTFSISEDAANNDDVGTVIASDAEGDILTYSIVGGNTDNAFKINATTGLIEVNNSSALDFDTDSSYSLNIRVTDNNTLGLRQDRTMTINLIDVDEAPSLDIGYVIETQNTGVLYSADTGNFYKNITTNRNNADWIAYAPTQLLNGVEAHLVTVTSNAEYVFVRDNVSASHVWLPLSDAAEEGKWIWTVGPEAGTQISQGNVDAVGWFNRWLGSEPN
ncbi:MAG: cadherin-like domain-containing protein, partial [Bdellovibrionales bacterium]